MSQPDLGRLDIRLHAVGALLHTPDGRYLMQCRDDIPGVHMAGYWGVFGGVMEDGESADAAMRRELMEELAFEPAELAWFTELTYSLHQVGRGLHRKFFFEAAIQERDVGRMHLGEGQALRLILPAELLTMAKIVPWDAFGVFLHSRRAPVFTDY